MQLPTQFLVQRQTTMYNGDLFEAIKHPDKGNRFSDANIKLTPKTIICFECKSL
jgi:hypothetical protein